MEADFKIVHKSGSSISFMANGDMELDCKGDVNINTSNETPVEQLAKDIVESLVSNAQKEIDT